MAPATQVPNFFMNFVNTVADLADSRQTPCEDNNLLAHQY